MNIKYRSFQRESIDRAIEYIEGPIKTPQIIVLPTAAGKSYVIAGIADYYDGPILVLQPSAELLAQNYTKYTEDYGNEASIYSASGGSKELGHVTFATLGTVKKAVDELRGLKKLLVLIDECHYKFSEKKGGEFRSFMDKLKPKKVLGLTATPFKLVPGPMGSGSHLKMLNRLWPSYFRGFLHVTQIKELIDQGYWTPSQDELWDFDTDGLALNSTGSNFTERSIRKFQEVNGINNKIYLRIVSMFQNQERGSLLAFLDSIETLDVMKVALEKKLGFEVGVVHSKTPKKERNRLVREFKAGNLKILLNHGVFTTGFDHPALDAIIMGYPTNSLSLLYQIYGRGVRVLEGKRDFLFSDFAMNIQRLGHPRTLEIIDYPGVGWAVFSNSVLKTGVDLLDIVQITKTDIDLKLSGGSLEDHTLSFGKHKGKKLSQLVKREIGYLKWLIDQDWLEDDLKADINAWLRKEVFGRAIENPIR